MINKTAYLFCLVVLFVLESLRIAHYFFELDFLTKNTLAPFIFSFVNVLDAVIWVYVAARLVLIALRKTSVFSLLAKGNLSPVTILGLIFVWLWLVFFTISVFLLASESDFVILAMATIPIAIETLPFAIFLVEMAFLNSLLARWRMTGKSGDSVE